jgi:hypothetical protein
MVRSSAAHRRRATTSSPPIAAGEVERLLGDAFDHARNAAVDRMPRQ